MKFIKKYIYLTIIFILFLEFLLNYFYTTRDLKNYRKLHCFYKKYLFLCPEENFSLLRKDHKLWKVTTNSFGERITYRTPKKEQYQEEIWFIGDSISFGYLVSDEDTTPFLLDKIQSIPVRNLGVDSIGTLGILERLNYALDIHPNTTIKHLIWIYNTSDFTDDVKELKTNLLKLTIFKIHYTLGKTSNIYNALLYLPKSFQSNTLIPETTIIDKDILNFNHITYKNIQYLYEFILKQNRIKNFLIIVYPGMDPISKKPDLNSPITLSLYKFLIENKIPVKNVFQEFHHSSNPYFIFDGHPNEEGYKIFTQVLIDHLKHL